MPKWYTLAKAEQGVKEAPGPSNNPAVIKYYADAGFSGIKQDSVAWCAAFANAMLERAGIRGSNSLLARSFLKWGQKLDRPVEGCVVVFKRGNSSWQGHVAFFVSETSTHVQVLGGNQSNAVNIRSFAKKSLLGYRWPANTPVEGAASKPSKEKQPMLRDGSTGWDVKALQERLEALNYHPGDIDGHFGEKTEDAVTLFQKRHELEVDGVVGPETWAALRDAKPRVLAGRAEDTAKALADKSRIVKKAVNLEKVAVGTGVVAGGAKAAKETGLVDEARDLVDKGNDVRGVVDSWSDFAGWALQHWWIILIVVAGIVWWQARGVIKARLEDHRAGKTV